MVIILSFRRTKLYLYNYCINISDTFEKFKFGAYTTKCAINTMEVKISFSLPRIKLAFTFQTKLLYFEKKLYEVFNFKKK